MTELAPAFSATLFAVRVTLVGVEFGRSNAPISTIPPRIRAKPVPRWSVVRGWLFASNARALLPALIATLPAVRAIVCVGPPLLARTFVPKMAA